MITGNFFLHLGDFSVSLSFVNIAYNKPLCCFKATETDPKSFSSSFEIALFHVYKFLLEVVQSQNYTS